MTKDFLGYDLGELDYLNIHLHERGLPYTNHVEKHALTTF